MIIVIIFMVIIMRYLISCMFKKKWLISKRIINNYLWNYRMNLLLQRWVNFLMLKLSKYICIIYLYKFICFIFISRWSGTIFILFKKTWLPCRPTGVEFWIMLASRHLTSIASSCVASYYYIYFFLYFLIIIFYNILINK